MIYHQKFSNIATMKTMLIAILFALPLYAQAPDAAPALSASQQIALKGVDDDEKNLQAQWTNDEGKRGAIAQEFTQQHPGWTIGRNNEPQKLQAPTPPVEPKK